MFAVAQVAGRLTRQARGPQRTHEKIVQQVDAAEVETPPGQDPPGETDTDSDGGDCYVRARDAGGVLVSQLSRIGVGPYGQHHRGAGQPYSSLQIKGTGDGAS
jgi:hypothetical protein